MIKGDIETNKFRQNFIGMGVAHNSMAIESGYN